ncbi:carbohydrate ABC transporter permease [Paenibacillus sp. FSL H7-0942]|uniref:Aldouronate transport system permease protein n=2 Tax=Paenibacillus TaxID=44249 RepID=A0ABS4RU95_PAEXY|nr:MULTISPECIES: carbohydrate ABC transporter permease [Paenibacillus]ETT39936.1 binding-protein-dependent transport system inner membrane protein [Paenibacillus sp. FSL R5-192]MBP2246458.1 putative aldouronate transport system permease protein [Paenibacillus xylanexedens]MCF7757920.1 carbohydrate ABC transporter permease [Paenibacillus xylanexedens]MCP1424743.1 putative aldouronate transport system permease protein [Paenibacillus xylanexedens]OMF40230.1 sugar ABC transporter permease [Paeniba
MKRFSRNRSLGDSIFSITNGIFMLLVMVVTLYPFLNTIAVSFNNGLDTIRGGIYLWPREWTLQNYVSVFQNPNLTQAAFVSVARTVVGTVVQLFCTAMLAYVLSRKEYMFNKLVTTLFVMTMYFSGGLIPGYMLIKQVGLLNSFWVYIIPGLIGVFNMIVIRTYIQGLSEGLIESAKMDGAGDFRIFMRIVLPLSKPVLATVALFIAVGQWNSWFDSMLYTAGNRNLTTLQYELMKLLSSATSQGGTVNVDSFKNVTNMVTPVSIRAAITVVTAMPIVLLYPFLQKYFVTGLTIGGVKE